MFPRGMPFYFVWLLGRQYLPRDFGTRSLFRFWTDVFCAQHFLARRLSPAWPSFPQNGPGTRPGGTNLDDIQVMPRLLYSDCQAFAPKHLIYSIFVARLSCNKAFTPQSFQHRQGDRETRPGRADPPSRRPVPRRAIYTAVTEGRR